MNLTPSVEAEVVSTHKEGQEVFEAVNNFDIASQEDLTFATELIQEAKSRAKKLDDQRQEITKPINLALRKVNDLFKPAITAFQQIESTLKRKIVVYDALQKRRAQEALEAAQQAAQAGESQALTQALATHDDAAQATKAQGLSAREAWTFRVTDPALVPREFLTVDEKALAAYARAKKGTASVPGVEFFSEAVIAVRSR